MFVPRQGRGILDPIKTLLLAYLTLFSFKNELQNCTYMHVLLFSISPPFSVNEMPMDHVSKSSETGRPAFLMSCVYFSSQLASTIIANLRHFNLFFYFEKLCWNPHAHKPKGKNGLWCRNTLEIDIFHNPVECSMCTRNDRDARLHVTMWRISSLIPQLYLPVLRGVSFRVTFKSNLGLALAHFPRLLGLDKFCRRNYKQNKRFLK